MKLKHLLFGILAVGLLAVGCEDPEKGSPRVEIKGTENGVLTFAKEEGTQTITMRANRDWRVSFNPATANEWINMQTSGEVTGEDGITLPISVSANTGFSREATVTFRAGTAKKTITVKQEGEGGSEDEATVYFNNFDKEAAVQSTGTDGKNHWPYLDQSECWKNEKGTGIANVTYAFKSMSARNNSNSNGSYSDYTSASGVNNLLFGANNYFEVKNIALGSAANYTLSFVGVRNEYGKDESIFSAEEFKVYVSNQDKLAEARWVELAYAFPNGMPNKRWDLASATFTVPAGTTSLSIYISTSLASSYRLDDLKLVEASAAGTAIDFTSGKAVGTDEGGSTGGDDNKFGTPAGDGTAASPYNVAAINQIAAALASGATSEQEYYMEGTVAKIREVSTTHGNASFDIKDDGADGTFYIFRCKYIGGESFVSEDQIKVGDKVVVKGYVTNYMGNTPETTQGAEIISINGGSEVTKVLSVSTKELTAIADDESATFKVGGNVAWTASVTEGSEFVKILSGASGNGAGDVVLELSKNTVDTPRTAKITVTTTEDVAEKSIEVVLTQLKKGEVPAGANITWAKADWTGSGNTYTLTKDGYTITIDKAAGGTAPALRDDNSVRLYAKGLLTISGPAFTSVEIVLAGDAGFRYCPVTADSGTVGAQASGDKSVYWTGSASTVVFTVGDKAEYGSDGAAKAGQLRFAGINIK